MGKAMKNTVLTTAILLTVIACTQSPDENDVAAQVTPLPASATLTSTKVSVPWTGVALPTTGPILASTPTPTSTPEPNTPIRYIHNDDSAYLYEFRNQYCYTSSDISPLVIYKDGESVFEKMRPLILHAGYVLFERSLISYKDGEEFAENEIWRFDPNSSEWKLLVDSSSMFSLLDSSPPRVSRTGNFLSVYRIFPVRDTQFVVFNTIGEITSWIEPVYDLHRLDVESGNIDTILPASSGGMPFLFPEEDYIYLASSSHVSILQLSDWTLITSIYFNEVLGYHYPYIPLPSWNSAGDELVFVIVYRDEEFSTSLNFWKYAKDFQEFVLIARRSIGQADSGDSNDTYRVSQAAESIIYLDLRRMDDHKGIVIRVLDTQSGKDRMTYELPQGIGQHEVNYGFLGGTEDWFYEVDEKYYISIDGAEPVQSPAPSIPRIQRVAIIPDYESCIEP